MVILISLIRVHAHERKLRYKLQTLSQHVGYGNIVGVVVVRVEREHASAQTVHHIHAGSFHYNVAHERNGQRAETAQKFVELSEFLFARQRTEQQKIRGFFEAEPVLAHKAAHYIFYIYAAVTQSSVARHAVALGVFGFAYHFRNIGKSRKHSFALLVAQSALNVVPVIKRIVYYGAFSRHFAQSFYLGHNLFQKFVKFHLLALRFDLFARSVSLFSALSRAVSRLS